MLETSSTIVTVLLATGLITTLIGIALLVWFIITLQDIKWSLRNISNKLSNSNSITTDIRICAIDKADPETRQRISDRYIKQQEDKE